MSNIRNIIWSGISILGQSGITFLSTVILARMLTPDDFGLIGIVTIFIAFAQIVVDSEMGGALLKKPTVTNADYSTLFYYNLVVSILIFLLLYFTAPLIADFYSEEALTDIIRIISLTIIIHAFRVTQRIMIFRDLNYKIYAIINLVSGIVSLGVAILIAMEGYGYWALVWMQIVLAVMHVVCMQIYNRFIPSLTFSRESFRYQFSFGISLLGSDTTRTIANNISTNIIGKISSMQFTGYYTQVGRITNFCQNSITTMMDQTIFPMMARMENPLKVLNVYHRLLWILSAGLLLVTVLFLVFAELIIRIVLGEEWMSTTEIFRILAISIPPASIQILCRNVIKTLGDTKKIFYLETVKSAIVIATLLAAAFAGNIWVVWAIVVSQIISCVIWLVSTERQIKKHIAGQTTKK